MVLQKDLHDSQVLEARVSGLPSWVRFYKTLGYILGSLLDVFEVVLFAIWEPHFREWADTDASGSNPERGSSLWKDYIPGFSPVQLVQSGTHTVVKLTISSTATDLWTCVTGTNGICMTTFSWCVYSFIILYGRGGQERATGCDWFRPVLLMVKYYTCAAHKEIKRN